MSFGPLDPLGLPEAALELPGCPACRALPHLEAELVGWFVAQSLADGDGRRRLYDAGGLCARHWRSVASQEQERRGSMLGTAQVLAEVLTRRQAGADSPVRCPICEDLDASAANRLYLLLVKLGPSALAQAPRSWGPCVPHLDGLRGLRLERWLGRWAERQADRAVPEAVAAARRYARTREQRHRHEATGTEAQDLLGAIATLTGPGDRCPVDPPDQSPVRPTGVTMPREEGAGQTGRGTAPSGRRRPLWVSGGVASVGAASFFSDAGHEIATAVLPSFITGVLGASAGVLGVIEGLSDALLGIAKLAAGPPANNPRQRVRIARGGYLLTAVLTAAIGLSSAVWQAGILRAAAWTSRGARGPARDALLASLAPRDAYGRSFGVERAGDNLGAVVGPLLAALLVAVVGIRHSFYFALLPGVCAAVAISVAAARAPRVAAVSRGRAGLQLGNLRHAGLLRPLLPVAVFELGNVATALLILRATQLLHHGARSLTVAASLAILVYAAHNLVAAVTALAGGGWIDRGGPRQGPRRVFVAGAVLYTVAYGGFALQVHAWPLLLLLFCLAGAGIGLAETAESTLVAHLLPDGLRGSGFGLLGGLQSAGDFLSSAVVGVLYAAVSPAAGFAYAAGWMVLSVAASALLRAPARQAT